MDQADKRMLGPYRVLDLSGASFDYAGFLLGSLGTDVIKIEPPGGDPARKLVPFLNEAADPEQNLAWLAYNAGKRGVTIDLTTSAGRDQFKGLAATADAVIESFAPGHLDGLGLGYENLKTFNPELIYVSITPFGQSGPYRDYRASDLVCWAMGGLLAQTGDPDRRPVRISHLDFAYLLAGMDAAWGLAAALYHRGNGGSGQRLDVAVQQSVAKTTFLAHESWEVTHQEPTRASSFYRVHRSEVQLRQVWECKDGYVAFLIFGGHWGATHDNPRFVKWLEELGLADDYIRNLDWAHLNWRCTPLPEVDRIHGYFGRLFMSMTKAELLRGALARRIALQPVNTPEDILVHPQLEARGYWQEVDYPELGLKLRHPGRFCLPGVSPCRISRRAPRIGEHNAELLDQAVAKKAAVASVMNSGDAALAGVKVLGFELAQAGPMASALLASYGAQVIRVESATRMDWHRQMGPFIGDTSSPDRSACYYHVNAGKMGLTLNLKHPRRMEVLEGLVKWADVVTENFAGGVMDRLGLGYEDLKRINPGIIMLSSDTYGQSGPFGGTPLYGVPLTALSGLPSLTGTPDRMPQFPGFAITDFIAPRTNALAVIAALDYRRRSGQGQFIDASQFEATVPLMSPLLLGYQAGGRMPPRHGNRSPHGAPHGVYRCLGEDRWCAICVFGEDDWGRFREAIGSPAWTAEARFATLDDRIANATALDALVDAWSESYTAEEVTRRLQAAGIAAGTVQTGKDLATDPQLAHAHFYRPLEHEDFGRFSYSGWPVAMSETPYQIRRAPFLGEHNEDIAVGLLGLTDTGFVSLLADGVLE